MNQVNKSFEKAVGFGAAANMKDRQAPLLALYSQDAEPARIVDYARTTSASVPASTPLYTEVVPGHDSNPRYSVGVHKAVGGIGDYPVPGDILCAAIASCLDSSIRIVANRLSIPLKHLAVNVVASVDVRGTLRVDQAVPVGFQSLEIEVDIQAMMKLPDSTIRTILNAAEQSCVVLQTIRSTPTISINTRSQADDRTAA